ncbi:MAG: MotA/TolQ/ExbB proton channel family protein [Oscillospiraceae bacterium]|nr:MotA/TolQ/ExbB proton channel family protein [Oscillospiraceae bacterium]
MAFFDSLPPGGLVVIALIAALFVLALALLFHLSARYRRLTVKCGAEAAPQRGFHGALYAEFAAAYKKYGRDVNTPAIITDVIGRRLGGLLLCERFLANAVSLFVTLGLFGTFLGLSMAVSSLTELISYSNTEEWLSVLDSVGGGLMSALGGMGVAFYTSLVGAGCSILLTILRTIFNPQTAREKLETRLELWLDAEVAPALPTDAAKDDADLVKRMVEAFRGSAEEIRKALDSAAASYAANTQAASAALVRAAGSNKTALEVFDRTVDKFNAGVHDFSEVDYNLRGSVERMDLAVRDLAGAMREINRRMGNESREGEEA